jgi:hypothetical protein
MKFRPPNRSSKRSTGGGVTVMAQPIKALCLVAATVLCMLLVQQATCEDVAYICPSTATSDNKQEFISSADSTPFGITKLSVTDYNSERTCPMFSI